MMPERLASTDAFKQLTEMVGSGPYKWNAKERVAGSLPFTIVSTAISRAESGTPEWTAGPKIAHFDRVEWHVIPDPGTAAAAMQTGRWIGGKIPTNDMLPLLRRQTNRVKAIQDPTGLIGLHAAQSALAAVRQSGDPARLLKAHRSNRLLIAVAGDDPTMWHVPTGFFCPGLPMASDAGLEVFTGKRDYDAVKKEIAAAGYKGEKIVILAPTDFPILKAEADVCADMLKKIGLNVDYQAMDWGTVVQRRAKKDPPDKGGWSVFNTFWSGLDQSNPVGHVFLRGNGKAGTMGWPTAPKIEELRTDWIDAPDEAAQKKIAQQIQLQAFQDVPYVPLGQNFYMTSYQKDISGVLDGFVIFWNVKRT